MSVKALQDYTFVSKYARFLPERKRRETWDEAVERVCNMHLRKYPQIENEINWAFEQVRRRKVLGSQRALQFGGPAIEKNHARIYNCCASYCDRPRFFQEAFWLLLCGTGVGFSVQKHHVAKLPCFVGQKRFGKKVFVVPDSIEGWSDALGVLISSYFPDGDFPEFCGYEVVFDSSLIRREGSPLRSSSGKAPGPKPLMNALEKIRTLLDRCLADGQEKLRPIDAYDIVMHASDAVLSGGVRRSATISLFSFDDDEMAEAKTGNWRAENPQRARSNNSAILLKDKTTKEEFLNLLARTKQFGEPGFIWAYSTEHLVNPCAEISFYAKDEDGNSGWCFCNLCEINGRKCKTEKDFYIACKAAAIIGTCQAGYTKFNYLNEATKRIVEKEALLGVSITGMMDNPEVLFNPKLQRKMARMILKINAEIAAKIGINPTARATCTKPAGTTSCILGTSSGIHPHHAKRYIRRSQCNYLEPPLQFFKKINPVAVEKSVWSANNTDEIISFCVEVEKGAKTKNDIGAVDLLTLVKLTQQNWVIHGTVKERCLQPWLVHNVSNTITVRDEEWEIVGDFIYDNRQYFTGISLLPISGDKDYPQAPFAAIYTPHEVVRMYGNGSIMASGLIVDGLHAFANNLWKACDFVLGIESLQEPLKPVGDTVRFDHMQAYQEKLKVYEMQKDWIRRARQFADRYFDSDVRKMTYCLKDVNNWHYWCSLKREYKQVDYTEMVEEDDRTTVEKTISCSGGACFLSYA